MRKKPCSQQMAPLPESRVSTTAPFAHCGIDLMGPFLVRMKMRAKQKVWIAIFTCFQTRSVHSESVFSLDTSSVINAIIRFNARRPGLTQMYSDRGTNFRSAATVLTKELRQINEEAEDALARKGIIWEFNPPHAPHRGGVWERIVALFKKHIGRIQEVNKQTISYNIFNTIIVEAEGILNRRPLSQVSSDSRDTSAITPNFILSPATINMASPALIDMAPSSSGDLKACWRKALSQVEAFWRDFKTDYLLLLHQRQKWQKSKTDMKKDDLVIIVDDTKKRDMWKLGRVIKTLFG